MFSFILLYYLVEDARFLRAPIYYVTSRTLAPSSIEDLPQNVPCSVKPCNVGEINLRLVTMGTHLTLGLKFDFSYLDTRTLSPFTGPNRRMLQLNGEDQCNAVAKKSQVDQAISSISCTTFCDQTRNGASVYRNLDIKEDNLQVIKDWLKGGPQVW